MNTLILNKIKLALLSQGVSDITIRIYGNDVRVIHNSSKMIFDFRPYLNGYVILDDNDQELFIFNSLCDTASYIYSFIISYFLRIPNRGYDSEISFFLVYEHDESVNSLKLELIRTHIIIIYKQPGQVFSYELLKQHATPVSLHYTNNVCFKFNSLCTTIAHNTRRGIGNTICVNKTTFHKMMNLWHPKLKLNLILMKHIILDEKMLDDEILLWYQGDSLYDRPVSIHRAGYATHPNINNMIYHITFTQEN